MKIGIITHPLGRNYGGILQNYAMQAILLKIGHKVITCDYDGKELSLRVKEKIKLFIERKKYKHFSLLRKFVDDKIIRTQKTHLIPNDFVSQYDLDAIIVGSDQVWRPRYVYNIRHLFLSQFNNAKIKRIAYAVSFGTSNWEYTNSETLDCQALISKFDAVSVREDSGVLLCNKYLKTDAQQVLDPTLLLNKNDYLNLCQSVDNQIPDNCVFGYFLDDYYKYRAFIIDLFKDRPVYLIEPKNDDKCCPSIEEWLIAFDKSSYVFCDSFHGVVFSIIFNKPFVAIANENRGLSRFTSLLRMFELDNRLVFSIEEAKGIINKPIDWCRVNEILASQIKLSEEFLIKSLNK